MDPFTISLIVGAGAQVVSSIVGQLMSQGQEDQARQLYAEASKYYDNLPSPQAQTVNQLAPADPTLREAQMGALDQMSKFDPNGGLTLSDKIALNGVQNQVSQRNAAERAANLSSFQRRGMGGSMAELATDLAGQQQNANQANEMGDNAVANAQQRYYNSLTGRAQMAGGIRNQDQAEAEARSKIDMYNAGARERNFNNQMNLANAKAGNAYKQAGFQQQQAQNTRDFWGGLGNAAGSAADAFGGYYAKNSGPSGNSAPDVSYNEPMSAGSQYPSFGNDWDKWSQWAYGKGPG